jgi:hypothetical protein
MTEDTNGFAPPSLSPETIAYQQSLLADPAWCRTYPEYATMLRATLDEALAATNYQPPAADPRAPAQRLHDQQRGVAFDPAGNTVLPAQLGALVERDAAGKAPNPEQVAEHLDRAGLDPKAVLADAAFALEKAGSGVKAEMLTAHCVAQLAVWAQHLRQHARTRPQ